MIRLIIALGNPGKQYARTRHNIGRMVLDDFLKDRAPVWKSKFKGSLASLPGTGIQFLKPETFMNRSGLSAESARSFYSLSADQLLVIHDDLETPFSTVTLRQGGGVRGHNGLRSLQQHLPSREFYRLAVGIGRPKHGEISSFVLQRFDPLEEAHLESILVLACGMLREILSGDCSPRRHEIG